MRNVKAVTIILACALASAALSCSKDSPGGKNYYMSGSERSEAVSALYEQEALGEGVSGITLYPKTRGKFSGKIYHIEKAYSLVFAADMMNATVDLDDIILCSVGASNYISTLGTYVVVDGKLLDTYVAGSYSNCKVSGTASFKYNGKKGTLEVTVENGEVCFYDNDSHLLGKENVSCHYKGPVSVK